MLKQMSLAAAFAALIVPASAEAVAINDTITCAITGGGTFQCDTASNTVQDGALEFNVGTSPSFDFLSADFGNGTLRISALRNSSLGSTILNFSNSTSAFTGFALTGSNGFSGFDASDVALTNGLLTIDLRDTQNTAGGFINLNLAGNAVPEPATWVAMLLGFGALGHAMRGAKRRQRTTVSYA